jgi:hypothetical protein
MAGKVLKKETNMDKFNGSANMWWSAENPATAHKSL